MAEEILNTAIPEEEAPIAESPIVESTTVEESIPDGKENLKLLHSALSGDTEYADLVPKDFNKFIEQYKDPQNATLLFQSLRGDTEYSDMIPSDPVKAASMFGVTINAKGLGKPSAVPSASVGGGSATKGRGVEQPSTSPQKSSEASLDNIQQAMQVYADGKGAFPETLSAADVKELRKQVPGGELPNISDEKVAKMLAGKSPKQVRIESVNAIPDIKERKTEQARMYLDFSREKSAENQQLDQNITALKQGMDQIKSEGINVYQQLQNPNIDPQTAAILNEQLQQTQANYNQAASDYNSELEKYQQNARFIKTMGAGGLSNLKGGYHPSNFLMPNDPGEVMTASAWNSTVPALLKTLGAVVDIMPSALPTDRNVVSDAIFKLADNATIDVGKYSPQANVSLMDDVNVYNTSQLFGNLLGSVAMTFGGGAAAGTIGAQTAGFSQVYGDVYKQGRDAGLTEAESMFFALPTGLVAAYFGDKGVETLAGAFGKTSLKSAIKQGVKELAEKRTPQMMMEFGQKVLTNTLEGAAKEGLQEGSEFVTEFGSKKGASLKEGVKFQDDLSLKGFGKGLAESAITGAAGGGLLGPFFGAGRNSAFADVVTKASRDPQAEIDFMEQVNASVAANDITPEQKQQMVEMLEKTKQAASTVPPVVESEPARAEATALVLEQQDLEQQIEQTNPAMAKPLQDRLDAINARLGEIAEGKNLPAEEEAPTTQAGSVGAVGDELIEFAKERSDVNDIFELNWEGYSDEEMKSLHDRNDVVEEKGKQIFEKYATAEEKKEFDKLGKRTIGEKLKKDKYSAFRRQHNYREDVLDRITKGLQEPIKAVEQSLKESPTSEQAPQPKAAPQAKVEVQADNISKEDNDKWTSIIDQSTSPRELDKIIDSIDADGQMTPDLITAINTKRESLSPQPTPTAEATPTTAETAPQEKGEFSIQGTFRGLTHVLGDPANMLPDFRNTGSIDKPTFSESVQKGKKFFTLSIPQADDVYRQGYLSVSLVFPETTTKTMADVKAALEAKVAEAKAVIATARDKGSSAEAYLKNKVSAEYSEPTPTTEAQAPVVDALKDVKSTAEALTPNAIQEISDASGLLFPLSEDTPTIISERYHKAKADGSNPELVNAVEQALSPKAEEAAPSLPPVQFEAPKLNLGTPKNPFDAELEKLGYSEGDIQGMTMEQKQEIVTNKTNAPVVESTAKVDSVKENKKQEKIAEAQAKLDEEATSEQAPESFPAQEGAASEQEKEFKAHPELEQVYRDLNAAVTKNVDPKTLEAVKRNPTLVMVEKALRELERKGVIKIDCN